MNKENAYLRAEKRVKELKGFYDNLLSFFIFLILWIVFYRKIIAFILTRVNGADADFREWLDVNAWLIPAIWVLILLIHGLYVFTKRFNFLKKWEQKKLNEFLTEDNQFNNSTKWE